MKRSKGGPLLKKNHMLQCGPCNVVLPWYRNWLFGADVVVYSDHNPVTYLTEASPKSANLMWRALAIQEFNVKFCYKPGNRNTAADCLCRPSPAEDVKAE